MNSLLKREREHTVCTKHLLFYTLKTIKNTSEMNAFLMEKATSNTVLNKCTDLLNAHFEL